MQLTHYIVVRRDLPLGVMAAQIAHAAGESFYLLCLRSSVSEHSVLAERSQVQILSEAPFDPAQTIAVVLGARNEHKLARLVRNLDQAAVPYVAIREVDAPYAGQLMAVGLMPDVKEHISRHVHEFWRLPNERSEEQQAAGAVDPSAPNPGTPPARDQKASS